MFGTHLQVLIVREINDSQLVQVLEDTRDVQKGVVAEVYLLQLRQLGRKQSGKRRQAVVTDI